MILYIDFRERWFIENIREFTNHHIDITSNMFNVTIHNVELECIVTNLEVGDFIIGTSLDTDIKLVIERKTYSDLTSSITDGRFRQQKQRLQDSVNDASKIMYIIETRSAETRSAETRSAETRAAKTQAMTRGAILNLILKHNYKVLKTDSTDDTIIQLVTIYKKIKEDNLVTAATKNVDAPVKLISKKQAVDGNIFATQLSAITGVSYSTALCITKHYKNAKELIDAYRQSDSADNLLADISVTDKRRVGKALSKKIYYALCE